jgi:hypothetical protein
MAGVVLECGHNRQVCGAEVVLVLVEVVELEVVVEVAVEADVEVEVVLVVVVDEEIAGLQAKLALRLDSGEAVERLEMELRQREELEEELAEQKRRAGVGGARRGAAGGGAGAGDGAAGEGDGAAGGGDGGGAEGEGGRQRRAGRHPGQG